MTQTATDWMFDQLWETPKDKLAWFKILMKAKEMEKEHLMMAYNDGYVNAVFKGTRKPIEYYNETYK